MYHIIEVPSSDGGFDEVELIHDNWVLPDKKHCYWPPFMKNQLEYALRVGTKPTNDWRIYGMRIIWSGDNYEDAEEKKSDREMTFQSRIFQLVETINYKVEGNSKMLQYLIQKDEKDMEEDLPQLPLRTLAEFEEFEAYLDIPENFNKMVQVFSKKGGGDTFRVTRRVLKAILSYEVAALFNWAGRGEKLPLKDRKSKQLIICSVRQTKSLQNVEEKDIEEAIKSFLKYSPLRLK